MAKQSQLVEKTKKKLGTHQQRTATTEVAVPTRWRWKETKENGKIWGFHFFKKKKRTTTTK